MRLSHVPSLSKKPLNVTVHPTLHERVVNPLPQKILTLVPLPNRVRGDSVEGDRSPVEFALSSLIPS
jgi:hypothetical protein